MSIVSTILPGHPRADNDVIPRGISWKS